MDFNVFYCILIQFNGVLMDFAVFYCILLYFRSLLIPRTLEGRVVKTVSELVILPVLPLVRIFQSSFVSLVFFRCPKTPRKIDAQRAVFVGLQNSFLPCPKTVLFGHPKTHGGACALVSCAFCSAMNFSSSINP